MKNIFDTADYTEEYDIKDRKENSLLSYFCYCTVLCLVPLAMHNKSPYMRFHTNQGALLTIIQISGLMLFTALSWLPSVGSFFRILKLIFNLLCFVFALSGVMNVRNRKAKELPIIGYLRLFD